MTELDGYLRTPVGGAPAAGVFAPPARPGCVAAGLAWSSFFPAGVWLGDGVDPNQAVRWGTAAGTTPQGAGLDATVMPGRQYTASVYVFPLTPSTQEIAVDGAGPGTSTALPLVWTRLSVTFTATQPIHAVTVQTSGSVIPGGVYADDVQVEEAAAATTFTATGSAVYTVFRDFVERWPSSWKYRGYVGLADITCVDAFAALQSATLNTEYVMALLSMAPDYYWPLSEGSGSTMWAEGSGNNGPFLAENSSKYGAGTLPSSGTSIDIVGSPSTTGVTLVQGSAVGANCTGTFITCGPVAGTPGVLFPSSIGATTFSVTASIWYQAVLPRTAEVQMLIQVVTFAPNDTFLLMPICVFVNTDGSLAVQLIANGSGIYVVAGSAGAYDDGLPHLVVALGTQTVGGTSTVTLYVDNVLVATASASTATIGYLSTPATNVQIGARNDGSGYTQQLGGVVAQAALWSRALTADEINTLWLAGGEGFSGETSGTRVARYLSYTYAGATSVDTGQSIMGPATVSANTKALAAIQGVTASENGNFWVDAEGEPEFAARTRRYLELTSTVTFGEDTEGGETPYQEDIAYSVDPTLVRNDVRVTQSGGIIAVGGTQAAILASQAINFVQSFQRTIDVLDPNEVQDAANYIFNQFSTARQRVESVTIDPASWPTVWPVVLGLEIGDRVTVTRRAKAANAGAGFSMTGDFFVEQISHDNIDMAAGTWLTTLLLSPVDLSQVGLFDNDTYGRFASGGAAIHTAITAADTSVVVDSTSGADVFTTDGTPFGATVGDETVTVTAVASAAVDGFNRTVSNGWGSADVGGAWSTSGGVAGNYAVAPSLGSQTMSTVNAPRSTFLTVDYSYVEAVYAMQVSAVATGAMITGAFTCRGTNSSNEYRYELLFQTNGTVDARIRSVVAGSATTLGSNTGVLAVYTGATVINVRCQAFGSTLRMRVWTDTIEPTDLWQVTATDTTWTSGVVGFLSQANTGCTNVNPAISVGGFTLVNPQTVTFTRPTDGTAAAHDAGTAVQVATPFVFAY